MILYKKGNILESTDEAIVIPVNCVGIMGRGLAKQFADKHPGAKRIYQMACNGGLLSVEECYACELSETNPLYAYFLATKDHWRNPSKITYVKMGLESLAKKLIMYKIASISIPPLGCGLGQLKWLDVHNLIIDTLSKYAREGEVTIYEPFEARD